LILHRVLRARRFSSMLTGNNAVDSASANTGAGGEKSPTD
jgi:hypothetical protein